MLESYTALFPAPAAGVVAPTAQLGALYHQTAGWISARWLDFLLACAAAAAIYLVLNLIRAAGIRLCRRGATRTDWDSIIGRAIARTSRVFLLLVAIRLVAAYTDPPPLVLTTIVSLFTVGTVIQAAFWAREIVFGAIEQRTVEHSEHRQALASAFGIIRLLVTIALAAVALVLILSNLGVNVTGLIAGLGVGGIAIGLAAQGIFADLFAALAILFDGPFRVGDAISYNNGAGSGTVEKIGLKSTRIRGAAGEERIVANKNLLDFEILNTSRRLHNRFKFDFHLGYATPAEVVLLVPAMLREAVEGEGYTLIHGGLNGFGDSGLNYDVEFESADIDFPADARDKVAAAILTRFRGHDISFAYPTQINLVREKAGPDTTRLQAGPGYSEVRKPVREVR
ncbi:mechanosensitive ion channel family protein (plasmid) [Novosphingobium sp. BL-8A]|uniref:mechanosensitive ion channel family protein n=1 Tax=Novosphingobium sp. BL-8A TaxID=3127639 RepID=UPI003756B735